MTIIPKEKLQKDKFDTDSTANFLLYMMQKQKEAKLTFFKNLSSFFRQFLSLFYIFFNLHRSTLDSIYFNVFITASKGVMRQEVELSLSHVREIK